MQRKIPNINFRNLSSSSSGVDKLKLHSIPINKVKNVKSNVLYSIRGVVTLLLVGLTTLFNTSSCFAAIGVLGTVGDSGTISELTGGAATPATASLSLSNTSMTSSATTPGSTATVSTNVTVNVSNAESYTLTLKVDSTTMNVGNTIISAGNVVSDNTWGYKWDNANSFVAPSTSGTNLTVPALSNNSTNFTKTLAFGAKFASNAEAGHYKASGTLSLVATPKATTYTLADLTQMQQLTLAPEACANTPYLSGQTYSAEYTLTDVRDNNTYTVRKFSDGKCWMTQNLKLSNIVGSTPYTDGRRLIPSTSDIDAEWTLPASSTSGFSDNTASNAYYDSSVAGGTGYYTWCAATAGSCSSATTGGANATNSICPKGWKLPTGMVTGANTTNDFYNLFKNMGLTISSSLATSGNTSWGTGDLAIAQGSPYNFAYTGRVINGSLDYTDTYGYWWSRTAYGANLAYRLILNSSYVYPGTVTANRYFGFAVRCVAG